MPTISLTIPIAALGSVSAAYGALTGSALADAVKQDLIRYLKLTVRRALELQAEETARAAVTDIIIT